MRCANWYQPIQIWNIWGNIKFKSTVKNCKKEEWCPKQVGFQRKSNTIQVQQEGGIYIYMWRWIWRTEVDKEMGKEVDKEVSKESDKEVDKEMGWAFLRPVMRAQVRRGGGSAQPMIATGNAKIAGSLYNCRCLTAVIHGYTLKCPKLCRPMDIIHVYTGNTWYVYYT